MQQCRAAHFSLSVSFPRDHVIDVHLDELDAIPSAWLQSNALTICPDCRRPVEVSSAGTAVDHACSARTSHYPQQGTNFFTWTCCMEECGTIPFYRNAVTPRQHVIDVHRDAFERIPTNWLQYHSLILCPSCRVPCQMTAARTAEAHPCGVPLPATSLTASYESSSRRTPRPPRVYAPCPTCHILHAVTKTGFFSHKCVPAATEAPPAAPTAPPVRLPTDTRVVSKRSLALLEWANEVVQLADAFVAQPTLESYLEFTSMIEQYPPYVALQQRRSAREAEELKGRVRDPAFTDTGAASRARYRKCHRRLSKGGLSRARAALFPSVPLVYDVEVIAKLRTLFPSRDSPLDLPPLGQVPRRPSITPAQVCSYLNSRTPDTAGGVSKWTYDALIDAFCASKNPDHTSVLAKVVETIASARGLDDPVWQHLRTVRGVAISKPDGGIRPLGIGEALVILTAGVLTRQYRNDLKALIGPFDVGFATPGGAEVLTHTIRAALSLGTSPRCVIKVDVSNAFNSISRDAVLAAAHKIPALWPFVRARYGAVFDAQFTCQISHVSVTIPVTEGVAQGCPLAGPLYSAAQAVGYAVVRGKSPSTLLSSFFDDGYIVDTPQKAFAALGLLRVELAKICLSLKPSKCKAYMPQPTPEFIALAREAGVTTDQGVLVAGSPVGSDDYVSHHLEQKLVEVRRELDDLHEVMSLSAQFHDVTAHGVFTLLRKCIPTQFTNLLRSVPPRLSIPFASRVDEAVWTTARHVLHLIDLANSTETRDRVFLPVRLGGMGIMSLAETAHSAYSGSWALCGDEVRRLLPDTIEVPSDWFVRMPSGPVSPVLADLIGAVEHLQQSNALANVTPETWILTPEPRVQMTISQNLNVAKSDRILAGLSSPVLRASFLGARTPESGAWIDASPCFSWSRLTDAVFRCAAKTRLSIHPVRIDTCRCHMRNSSPAFPHPFYCSASYGSRGWRHNNIRDTLLEGLRRIPSTRTVSEPHIPDYWLQRPEYHVSNLDAKSPRGDIWVDSHGGAFPLTAMLDATVACPAPATPGVATKPRVTADAAYQDKMDDYASRWLIPKGQFIPIALEPTGALSSLSLEFIKTAARCYSPPGTYAYSLFLRELLTRISVALQRGNCSMLQRAHLRSTVDQSSTVAVVVGGSSS